jgi:hypothetical protein
MAFKEDLGLYHCFDLIFIELSSISILGFPISSTYLMDGSLELIIVTSGIF